MLKVYGLKNCDTCRKARKWLKEHGIEHDFMDVRADGVDKQQIQKWVQAVGTETLLNRRGTTWRKLDERQRSNLTNSTALELMHAHPALMKRPVFETGDEVLVGFSLATQEALSNS